MIRLTLGQQALIEIPNKRFKTCRYHGSHIQRLTHRRPSAEAAAFEFGFPALPRVWGNTDQTRQPFMVQPSQFGQHRHQCSRCYRTDAFDLLRHLGFAVKMRAGRILMPDLSLFTPSPADKSPSPAACRRASRACSGNGRFAASQNACESRLRGRLLSARSNRG